MNRVMHDDILARDDASRAAVANENANAAFSEDDGDTEALLTVRGYRFLISEDAEAARTDIVRIDHLNKYLKGARDGNVLPLYEKSLQNHLFSTPVGWEYLQELRGMLIDQGMAPDELSPIPIPVPITRRRLPGDYRTKERIAETPEENAKVRPGRFSMILNVILILLVIGMFVISYTSKMDNILNYRRNVTNEYSSWAEDLKERERRIREKELELHLTAEEPDGTAEDTDR
ncbi:MAG: hypothetical protein II800_00545 [Lachnospiraceae bacterium]|nr:hypothetical protein [Lachnospiraceae bacterium]